MDYGVPEHVPHPGKLRMGAVCVLSKRALIGNRQYFVAHHRHELYSLASCSLLRMDRTYELLHPLFSLVSNAYECGIR